MRTRTIIGTLAVTAALLFGSTAPAVATRPQPNRTSITSMARYYHCNIVATPGPDYFHGKIVRGWIIGSPRRYYHIDPALVGWEPPLGPRGWDFIKAACQF